MPDFVYTTAIKKLRKLKARKRVVPGGTSAGKTFGIIPILIDYAAREKGKEISIVSESVPHLRKGAMKDFLNIMKSTNRYIDSHWNRTHLTYSFSSGSYIEFFSADQESKVRGPRRNVIYINECNNINHATYHQLAIRTDEIVWLDYNPTAPFWIDKEIADDPDLEVLRLTYKDNEALSESIIREIEMCRNRGFYSHTLEPFELFKDSNIKDAYWANWWKVYGLGETGSIQGTIFQINIVDEMPTEYKWKAYGLDWGYSIDPTAVNDVRFSAGEYWIDEVVYEKGLLNRDIDNRLRKSGVGMHEEIFADSAEPKSINELYALGWNVKPVVKGSDSIRHGIELMQQCKINVTSRSTNTIKEFRNYTWATDRTGEPVSPNKPIDAWNHAIDDIRYVITMKKGIRSGQILAA